MFIVFEGCDRSGKSTQARRLAKHLESQGEVIVHLLGFPDRSCAAATGPLLNRYLQGELELSPKAAHLLFSANRWEKQPQLQEWLDRGEHIILDRYWYSGVAYSLAANNLPWQWTLAPDAGLPVPDCVIYLTVMQTAQQQATATEEEEEEELQKRPQWGEERFERMEIQRAVHCAYERVAALENMPPWKCVDAKGTEEEVFDRILQQIISLQGK
jgi:dTMP kinase